MNYFGTTRTVCDVVMINNQPIRVEATWRVEDDEQKIDVYISDPSVPNRQPITLLGLDSRGVASIAEVFLTVDRMLSVEAADVSSIIP